MLPARALSSRSQLAFPARAPSSRLLRIIRKDLSTAMGFDNLFIILSYDLHVELIDRNLHIILFD